MKNAVAFVQLATVTGAAALLLALFIFAPGKAKATPAMTQQTGAGCPVCHTMPPPALNDAGKKYKATGKL